MLKHTLRTPSCLTDLFVPTNAGGAELRILNMYGLLSQHISFVPAEVFVSQGFLGRNGNIQQQV